MHLLISILLLLSAFFQENTEIKPSEPGTRVLVTDFGAVGDGERDNTSAIQRALDEAAPGDTVYIPEGTFPVRTLQLRSGVHLVSEGLLTHHSQAKAGDYSIEKQNSPNPLLKGTGITDVYISVRARSKNEAIYLDRCKQIRIVNSDLGGDSTKLRAYPGILAFQCSGLEVLSSKIHHFGSERQETHSYQPGTGIRVLSSNTISIRDSEIYENGENGVFLHGCRKAEVLNNTIHHNGMSGIQVAFGNSGKESDYIFTGNVLDKNAADGIDINNRSPEKAKDISTTIAYNLSCGNGFVQGQSTPDGSGFGTLINVSNILLYRNQAISNNRPALYIEDCGTILSKENHADNQVEITLGLDELLIESSQYSSINLMANTKARHILIRDSHIGSLSLPNGIQVEQFEVLSNTFSHARFNINMKGNLTLGKNTLKNSSSSNLLFIAGAGSALIEDNELESTQAPAVLVKKSAQNIQLKGNRLRSPGPVILDEGSPGLLLQDNRLELLPGDSESLTFKSNYPNGIQLLGNEHHGIAGQPTLVLVGKGTAKISDKLVTGTADYAAVEVEKD
ncbi:right-handed parallel beta-helix repeat-containing protein [Algoriphagus sp. H41]|uniref:Right-handed parallel beta-helix repeat-containing protein n=1 Tax=Algoriphagus oliviformis TaxID=2811231 RepID=A0ABS3BWT5_9BACT|nr:right-handed parallel beta-helix repeat-containing protein [Algoriphagus oliviformis]MBN7809338.1 right-handed parallel beta-helix repeat-containing protein [Algoriphagus oliviformis]